MINTLDRGAARSFESQLSFESIGLFSYTTHVCFLLRQIAFVREKYVCVLYYTPLTA